MKLDLSNFWEIFSIPKPVPEYRFCERRWRFDWAWVPYKVALEIEGGIFLGGRHNRPIGYQKDMEKYNRATLEGWRVFRFTPAQFKSGEAGEFLEDFFKREMAENLRFQESTT